MKTKRARTRYGEMFVAAEDNCVGRSLTDYGEWSQSEIDLIQQIIRPGSLVLDIGANVGYHTLAFSKAVGPTGRVVSFEPQPGIFQLLATNIAINDLSNVTALNMALGEARGIVDMPPFNYEGSQNYGALDIRKMLKDERSVAQYTPVPLQKLDEIAYARNASLIKADVEGMELAVLRGGMELIRRRQPALFLENNAPDESSEQLLTFLSEIKYDCYWQISFSLNPKNFAGNTNNIFDRGNSVNVLAIPQSAQSDIRGFRKISSVTDHPYKWSSQAAASID